MWQASRQTNKIRKKFFKSILRQDISFFDLNLAGQLNTRLAEFVVVVHKFYITFLKILRAKVYKTYIGYFLFKTNSFTFK